WQRVACAGRCVDEHLGPRARGLAGDIEQVLDANDRSIERTESHTGTRSRVGRVGGVAGDLRINSEAGAGTLAGRVGDASESLFYPIPRREGRRHTGHFFLLTVLRIESLSRPASVRRPERGALPCSHGRKYPAQQA